MKNITNNTAFIAICSIEYINHYKVLFNSLKIHSPNSSQILYYIGDVQEPFDQKVDITGWFNNTTYYDTLTKICSLRARVVLDAFSKGYEKVVFLGAKVEFFQSPDEMLILLNRYNAVVTPHILEPLPEDGKFPSNASVAWTGHISTDVVGFRNTPAIRKFLEWQDEVMKTKCATTNYTYLDQSWLNFLPFSVDNIHILRVDTWNVAYWNYVQRNMRLVNGEWFTNDGKLVCFQYSGLEKGNEEKISRHQNRYVASGDFLQFLKSYGTRI